MKVLTSIVEWLLSSRRGSACGPGNWAVRIFAFHFCSVLVPSDRAEVGVPFELSLLEEGVPGESQSQRTPAQHIHCPLRHCLCSGIQLLHLCLTSLQASVTLHPLQAQAWMELDGTASR